MSKTTTATQDIISELLAMIDDYPEILWAANAPVDYGAGVVDPSEDADRWMYSMTAEGKAAMRTHRGESDSYWISNSDGSRTWGGAKAALSRIETLACRAQPEAVKFGTSIHNEVKAWARMGYELFYPPEGERGYVQWTTWLRWRDGWSQIIGTLHNLDVATPRPQPVKPMTPKRRRTRSPKPLTARQTEVVQLVGECKGDIAEAARRLGRNHKTVNETYKVAMAKLGKAITVKPKTQALPRDLRGGVDIAAADDGPGASESVKPRNVRRDVRGY